MPKAYPKEFREDVIRVARTGDAPLRQVAKDFGIAESCLRRWIRKAELAEDRPLDISACGVRGAASVEAPQPGTRAGERDSAQSGGVLRPGDLPKMKYPLSQELAEDGIPVAVTLGAPPFESEARAGGSGS